MTAPAQVRGYVCSVEGCENPGVARMLCKPHYRRSWYEQNREHAIAYSRAKRDPEVDRQRHREKRNDPQYLAMRKAAYDRWRTEHPDRAKLAGRRWREANPERVRETFRRWFGASPDAQIKKRGYGRARRARLSGAKVDYVEILAEHGMVCHLCGGEIESLADLHMDHVTPLSRGGAHSPENVRPSHAICNMRKGARLTA